MGFKGDFVAAKDLGMLTLITMLKISEKWTKSLISCSCRTEKMEILRVMWQSGGHRILEDSRLLREPWSWPDLSTLRDLCHRCFRLKSMVPGSQYTSQFLTN